MKGRLYRCCSYSVIGIITFFKSVARLQLVKAENTSACVTANCKVRRTATALYLIVVLSGMCKMSINPIIHSLSPPNNHSTLPVTIRGTLT
jgi:hypothetical protein